MSDRPKRLRKVNRWRALDDSSPEPDSSDVVDIDQTATGSDEPRVDARPVLPARKRGRPRKTAAAAAGPAARNTSTPAECGLDALLGVIDRDGDALLADEDGDQPKDRKWDEHERSDHAELFRKRTKESTAKQYAPTIRAYLAWCKENKVAPEVVSLGNVYKLGRFYNEYCSGKWGWHLGGGWQPNQQQPFSQPPVQQQSQHPFQQQFMPEAHQSRPQPEQHWGQQQMSMTVQLLQKQIQMQQADLAAMPPGLQRSEKAAQVQDMLQQLLKLQQAQVLQSSQQPSTRGAAAAANISSMMGQDPIAAFMEPGINNNPTFRAALGSRLSGPQSSSSSTAAGLMGYCTHVLLDKLEEMLPQALQQAMQQAGFAPGTTAAVTGVGSNAKAAPKAAATAAAATKGNSSGALSQQAVKGCPLQREVPFLKDQKSLPAMIKWYTQERDIPIEEGGEVKMYTRSELRDQGKSWVSRDSSKRAAEYDVMYDRLKAVIVQLTKETDQPKSMDDAVQHVVQTAKVCQSGGITMFKYMEQCRAWRKAQKQAEAAAAAAEQEDEEEELATE